MIIAHSILILIASLFLTSLFLRRNLITPIAQRRYVGGWKLLVGIVVVYLVQATLVIYSPGKSLFQTSVMVSTHLICLILLLVNRHLPGAKLAAVGISLNVAVIVANGGWMPLAPDAAYFVHPDRPIPELYTRAPNSKVVLLPREETNLWILSDIIRVTVPWRRSVISIGDVLLIAGVALFLFQPMFQRKRKPLRGHKKQSENIMQLS